MLDNIGRGSWKSETGVRAVLRLLCRDRDIVRGRKRRRNCGTSGGGQIGLDDGEVGQAGQGAPGAAAGALLEMRTEQGTQAGLDPLSPRARVCPRSGEIGSGDI